MMPEQDEGELLRRRLRAMSAVNEQLRAQLAAARDELETAPRQAVAPDPLGGPAELVPVGLAPRRAAIAADWLDQIPTPAVGTRPFVVEGSDGALYVVDGGVRRRLRSGLLGIAVEVALGERRPVDDAELARWPEGAPVDLLEGAAGPPFVVIEGRRLAVRGLPLPHPVDQAQVDKLVTGPDLDVAAAVTPRRAHDASGWITALLPGRSVTPRLVTTPDGVGHVVEGAMRRQVRSAMLIPSLSVLLGEATPISESDLLDLTEGPAVEILEARAGDPFVVLGGRRSRLIGFPVPFPVLQDRADALPDGPPLDIVGTTRSIRRELLARAEAATAERERAERKVARVQAKLDDLQRAADRREANPDPIGELQALIDRRGGVVPMVTTAAKKRVKRAVRRVSG